MAAQTGIGEPHIKVGFRRLRNELLGFLENGQRPSWSPLLQEEKPSARQQVTILSTDFLLRGTAVGLLSWTASHA